MGWSKLLYKTNINVSIFEALLHLLFFPHYRHAAFLNTVLKHTLQIKPMHSAATCDVYRIAALMGPNAVHQGKCCAAG